MYVLQDTYYLIVKTLDRTHLITFLSELPSPSNQLSRSCVGYFLKVRQCKVYNVLPEQCSVKLYIYIYIFKRPILELKCKINTFNCSNYVP